MANTTLLVKSLDNSGVTYADPAKPDTTVRFRFSSTGKVLNGVPTPNFATEIIVNDNVPVTLGSVDALDAVSIRIRVSGSLASKSRITLFLTSLAAQLVAWDTENVNQGFRPTTAPVLLGTS